MHICKSILVSEWFAFSLICDRSHPHEKAHITATTSIVTFALNARIVSLTQSLSAECSHQPRKCSVSVGGSVVVSVLPVWVYPSNVFTLFAVIHLISIITAVPLVSVCSSLSAVGLSIVFMSSKVSKSSRTIATTTSTTTTMKQCVLCLCYMFLVLYFN